MIMKHSVNPETVRSIRSTATTCPDLHDLAAILKALTVPHRLAVEMLDHLLTIYRVL